MNLPEARGIASVDLTSQQVSPAWSHPSAGETFSMAVDGTIHRLFIPCRKPARMLVINSDSGSITAWAPVVGDADDVFVDEVRRLVYVIGGEGHIDLFYVRAGDALVARAHVPTAPGARTGLYVPEFGTSSWSLLPARARATPACWYSPSISSPIHVASTAPDVIESKWKAVRR